jgi:hypothetical protein
MHRFKMLGLALVVVVVGVAAVGAVYASATTMTLPTFSVQQSFTGTSGAGTLTSSGFTVSCKKDADEGTMEANRNLGLFTIEFKECESSLTTEKCHSLGLSGSSILLSGSWHLVLETLSGADLHLFLLLLNPLHFECGSVLFQVKGNVLGKIVQKGTPPSKEYELIVKATGAVQEFTSFENDNGTLVGTELLAAANLGFHKSGVELRENVLSMTAASQIEN